MLIDEAIQHYEEISAEYKQLAEWLNELKHLKSEKEKMIDTLSKKMADIGMCPNEKDIILRIVGGTTNYEVHCNTDCNHTGCKSYHYATKELPSVTPERKKGKWINVGFMTVECSECKVQFHELECANFCPNCGEGMEGQNG